MTADVSNADACACERCGAACRPGAAGSPDARLLRRARHGVCASCAITTFLQTTEPLRTVIAAKGPDVLLLDAVQQQVAAVLAAGASDAHPSEIDWQRVVDNWDLP